MHHKKSVTLFCSVALLLAACGEVVPVEGSPQVDASPEDRIDAMTPVDACAGDSIAVDDLLDCFVTAQCEWLVNCDSFAPTVQECVNLVMQDGNFDLKRSFDAVDAGVTTYNGTEAALCLAGIDANDCSAQPGEDCDEVFVGSIPDGGNCYKQDDCSGVDADCVHGDCLDQCCVGSCQNNAALGQDCGSRQCEDGAYCVFTQGQTPQSQCQSGAMNVVCNNDFQCDDGLYCPPSVGSCQPAIGEGGSCSSDSQCLDPMQCVGDNIGTGGAGTCALVDAVNDECDNSCEGDLYCNIPNQNSIGVCRLKEGPGGGCSSDSHCQPQLYCNDADGACRLLPLLNMACERDSCAPGLFCTNELPGSGSELGVCAQPVIVGNGCDSDNHCESDICGGQLTCESYVNCYAQ